MCTQHIMLLSISSTKGAEGSLHHSLRFTSTLLILNWQSNQLSVAEHVYFQLHIKYTEKY